MQKVALLTTDYGNNEERKNNAELYSGVSYYRLIKPLFEWKNDKYEFFHYGKNLSDEAQGKTVIEFWQDFIDRHDLFITKHIDNAEGASNLLFFAHQQGKKVLVDLDDNLFETREDQIANKYYKKGEEKRAIASAYLSLVDGILVSTQPLADYYKKHLKDIYDIETPIFVLPNYNDIQDFDFEPVPKLKDRIILGWQGSTTHFADLKTVTKPIERLLKEYPNLEFNLMGGVSHEDAPKLFEDMDDSILDRVYVSGGTQAWQGYPELLSKQPYDIAIAPLVECEFNRCKSHIKWMEYATMKIPCVASNVYPYTQDILGTKTIQHGVTGLISKDEEEWYRNIKLLIDDEELRLKIGQNAYDYVSREMQYKDHRELWNTALSYFADN